ncbi:hypothetical protein CerSpe_114890 [Prunus speciosa]
MLSSIDNGAPLSSSHVLPDLPHLSSHADSRSSMAVYLQNLKEIADVLAAAGQPLSESDLVAYILGGLPEEFDSTVKSIETRIERVNTDELHGLLLSREAVLLKRQARGSSHSQEPFHAYHATSCHG